MNKAQFLQWWNNNLWFGEQKRRVIQRVMVQSLIAPPTSGVWGVDVSHWNISPVDMKRMVDVYGMRFVIIKGADGSLKTKYHEDHILAAKAANIPFGLYVWLYPNNKVSIDAQVGTWAALYNVYKPKLGVFIDCEWTTYGGLPSNPTASDLRLAHDKFRSVTGRGAITYTAAGYANSYLTGFDWSKEPLWIANYGVTSPALPKGAAGYKFWQFTSTLDGRALDPNGNSELDGNVYNGTQSQFDVEYGFAELPQTPPTEAKGMFELKPAGTYNVTVRAAHADAPILGGAIASIPNGTVGKADAKYIFEVDKYVNGVLRIKAGDIWCHVTEAQGKPVDGWAAEIHLGTRYLNVTEIAVVPVSMDIDLPKGATVTLNFSDGTKETWVV